jgi:hypothetical protein
VTQRLRRFGAFWYDFLLGDDWRIAVGACLGLGLTAVLAHHGYDKAWWAMPIMVIGGLAISVRAKARSGFKPPR